MFFPQASRYDVSGVERAGWQSNNNGPFSNLQGKSYWFGVEDEQDSGSAWRFDFEDGNQTATSKSIELFVWPVRGGATNPAPAGFEVDEHTLALWHLDEGSGTAVNDASGNGNDGSITNASWTAGRFGTGLDFGTSDDYVLVSDSPSLSAVGDELTIECYIWLDSYPAELKPILGKWGTGGTEDDEYILQIKPDGILAASFSGTGGSVNSFLNQTPLPLSHWNYVAVVFDGTSGQLTFYLNNQPDGQTSISISLDRDTGEPFYLGKVTGNSDFNGKLDEIRVSNTARVISNPSVPVELVSFDASVFEDEVHLKWQTQTETGNFGFEIQRLSGSGWQKLDFVAGHGTTTEPQTYEYVDALSNSEPTSSTLSYRLKQIDTDGSFQYSQVLAVNVSNPETFRLAQNYPNPFNPSTTISYSIADPDLVVLNIYDINGRVVETLVHEVQPAGTYSFAFDAAELASGIYFYRLRAGNDFEETHKMLLVR